MNKQPEWEFVANLGDVSPLDYGGYFIFKDKTETYAPEAELLVEPCDDSNDGPYLVYRFTLDRFKMKRGYLVALSEYVEWFAKDLESVASCVGSTEDELQDQFCSIDPLERAHAYRAIGEYHGFDNLDSYPLTLTRSEVEARYQGIPL